MPNDCQPGITAALLLVGIFGPYSGMRKFFCGAKSVPALFLPKRRLCWVYRRLTFVIISIGNSFTAITSPLRHRSSICSSRRAFFIRKKGMPLLNGMPFRIAPPFGGNIQLVVSDRITPTQVGKTSCTNASRRHPNDRREYPAHCI